MERVSRFYHSKSPLHRFFFSGILMLMQNQTINIYAISFFKRYLMEIVCDVVDCKQRKFRSLTKSLSYFLAEELVEASSFGVDTSDQFISIHSNGECMVTMARTLDQQI